MQEDPAINLQVDCALNSSSVGESTIEVSGDDPIQIPTDIEGKSTREISTQTDDYINTYLPTTPNGKRCSHCDEEGNCDNTNIPTTPKGRRWSNSDKGTNVSPTFVFNSPTKVLLRNEFKNQRLRYSHKSEY
ncbi:uncharacterized protein LOC117169563 [Belonocnema kinseyi]|uniref:uncharacterized protein LOC117169563 n=1 Tax=Belonocnema kinseyi TaxID=2817044 RepID=UPI00143CEA63|nr:uncharacterized protein LOC117169563 [Belonocnema kinseyi]